MALNTRISAAMAIAMCDTAVDRLDLGAGAALVRIYTASQPADPDVAIGAQTLLAELTCSDPAFGAAVDNNPGGRATANAITADASANATGTAAWFRAVQSGGTAEIDGEVGTSGADMNLNTVSIVAGAEVAISSWTVTQPQS